MSQIRPTVGEEIASPYRYESARDEKLVESFLWKLLLLSALAYFVWSEKISINIGPFTFSKSEVEDQVARRKTDLLGLLGFHETRNYGVLLDAGDFDNLTFAIDPTYARRNDIQDDIVAQRMARCALFVQHFSPVAIAEMRHYGVPASILLAQSLLASNAGEDAVAVETNNFFKSRSALAHNTSAHFEASDNLENTGPVAIFPNLWGSFRAQSLLLRNTAPYANLFHFGKKDYRIWAYGLAAGGYSKDARYAQKLIALISSLQLDRFDAR